jgi:hypothetical protein
MGDHRVSIKIEFSMHDHKAKHDCWLNWSDSIPEQMAEWIAEQKEKAMDGWFAANDDAEARAAAEVEQRERKKLAELKAKYESPRS